MRVFSARVLERQRAVAAARALGQTYRRIGAAFGISAEQVRRDLNAFRSRSPTVLKKA